LELRLILVIKGENKVFIERARKCNKIKIIKIKRTNIAAIEGIQGGIRKIGTIRKNKTLNTE
jgi:hypothetical protein